MADTVTSNVEFNGSRRYLVRLTNKSDGTGEAAVAKVTKSGLKNSANNVPTKLNVRSIQWSVQGFTSILLAWDMTASETIDLLAAGNGFRDFTEAGALSPTTSGGTGNVILTTNGAAANATYDILLELELSN